MISVGKVLSSLGSRLNEETTRSYQHFRYSSKSIIRIGIATFCVLMLIEILISDSASGVSIGSRVFGILGWVCLSRVVRSDKGRNNDSRVWWMLILNGCIPFALLISYLAHAVNAPVEQDVRYFVVISYFVALCVYTQLTNSFLAAALGLFTSTTLAIVIISALFPGSFDLALSSMQLLIAQQLTAVLIGSVTNRNPEIARYDSYNAARRISQKIANDLRIPIEDIMSRSGVTARTLPTIIEGYKKAVEAELVQPEVTDRQLYVIGETPLDIEHEAKDAGTLIDMLLVNIAEEPTYGHAIETMQASDLVQSAHERYPYGNDIERDLVSIQIESDFVIAGPRLLLHHVVYNVLKNAIYYVQKAEKGNIEIRVNGPSPEISGIGGSIVIFDTGPGIHSSNIGSVFNRFFTTTETGRGSGIGLHFCRAIIDNLGGSISVMSEYGSWTEFTIDFPVARVPEVILNDRD